MDTTPYFSAACCRLYAVTQHCDDLCKQVQQAIAGGITMLQIREKGLDTPALVKLAKPILALCRDAAIPCLINDDVYAAKQLGADGIHVGQSDMNISEARRILGEIAIIGTSAHNVAEAVRAEKQGANYIGCGAVFPSGTKTDTTPLSSEELCKIRRAVSIPVVAIGGITADNVQALSGTGIDGIAVVSALFAQPDITRAARILRARSDSICGKEKCR